MIRCRSPHRHCQRLSCRVAADLSPAVLGSRRCAKRPGPKVCAEEARVEQPLQSSNSYRAVIGHRDSWLALSFRAKQWRVRKTQAAGHRAGKADAPARITTSKALRINPPLSWGVRTSFSAGLNAGDG